MSGKSKSIKSASSSTTVNASQPAKSMLSKRAQGQIQNGMKYGLDYNTLKLDYW